MKQKQNKYIPKKKNTIHQEIEFFFVEASKKSFMSINSGELILATPRTLVPGWYCVSKQSIKNKTILGSDSVLNLGIKPLEQGMVNYFSDFKFRGIGRVISEKLVQSEGINLLFKIAKGLSNFKGQIDLTLPQIKAIDEVWKREFSSGFLDIFLRDLKLRFDQVKSIKEKIGSNFIPTLLNEPETLIKKSIKVEGKDTNISRISIKDMNEILKRFNIEISEEKKVLMTLDDFLISYETKGSTCSYEFSAINQVSKICNLSQDKIKEHLYKNKDLFHLFKKKNNDFIESRESKTRDENIAKHIKQIISNKKKLKKLVFNEKKISDKIELSDEQLTAIKGCINSKISIITGGPGSGKSTTVIGLVKALKKSKKDVIICAPTGKAKKRLSQMSELSGCNVFTIHMHLELIKASKPKFDFMIIDESSMIDINLLLRLLKDFPTESSLIFIGDVDQLAPISPGQPFKDLIDSKKVTTFDLTGNFRQANQSSIVKVARLVRDSKAPEFDNSVNKDFSFIECNPQDTFKIIIELYSKKLNQNSDATSDDLIQILSPQNKGEIGIINLNKFIQNLKFKGQKSLFGNKNYEFFVGDKVRESSNKNDKGVMNGDIGRVLRKSKSSYYFEFDEIVHEYTFEEIQSIHLAYAITVHASQGSEYETVIMPCSQEHGWMLKKNLVYTAITRGKKDVTLVGNKQAFLNSLNAIEKRYTSLIEKFDF